SLDDLIKGEHASENFVGIVSVSFQCLFKGQRVQPLLGPNGTLQFANPVDQPRERDISLQRRNAVQNVTARFDHRFRTLLKQLFYLSLIFISVYAFDPFGDLWLMPPLCPWHEDSQPLV